MQELENKKAALELLQNETNDKLNDYKAQISMLQKEIDDYNKPAITPETMDKIQEAIEEAVEEFDFSDDDNFEKEFEIDYDSRIRLSNLDFINSCDLTEMITEKVLNLFKEADCPEEEPTADQINKQNNG